MKASCWQRLLSDPPFLSGSFPNALCWGPWSQGNWQAGSVCFGEIWEPNRLLQVQLPALLSQGCALLGPGCLKAVGATSMLLEELPKARRATALEVRLQEEYLGNCYPGLPIDSSSTSLFWCLFLAGPIWPMLAGTCLHKHTGIHTYTKVAYVVKQTLTAYSVLNQVRRELNRMRTKINTRLGDRLSSIC